MSTIKEGWQEISGKTKIGIIAGLVVVAGVAGNVGDTPVREAVAETTTTTTQVRTTTTRAPTATEATVRATVWDVIDLTNAESLTYSDLTWVDVTPDTAMAEMAETICTYYELHGDKEETILELGEAFFSGYTSYEDADLQLWIYFSGGVIDLLCEEKT